MDRFEIKNKLGVGSFGVVMRACYKKNGHEVRTQFFYFPYSLHSNVMYV